MATVHITFENTNPGTSNFKITHNNVKPASTGTSDDTVNFQGVQKGDTIEVSTDSPGDTTVTVSGVNTLPTKMTAVPGQHLADFFLVL